MLRLLFQPPNVPRRRGEPPPPPQTTITFNKSRGLLARCIMCMRRGLQDRNLPPSARRTKMLTSRLQLHLPPLNRDVGLSHAEKSLQTRQEPELSEPQKNKHFHGKTTLLKQFTCKWSFVNNISNFSFFLPCYCFIFLVMYDIIPVWLFELLVESHMSSHQVLDSNHQSYYVHTAQYRFKRPLSKKKVYVNACTPLFWTSVLKTLASTHSYSDL